MKNNISTGDLRIGNLLHYKGTTHTATVEIIHGKNHFDCRDEHGMFTPNGEYGPIAIDAEWLLAFGFVKSNTENLHFLPLFYVFFREGH